MRETVGVVGLGYVGIPLAVVFAEEGYDVVGYDVDAEKVASLEAGVDPTGDLAVDALVESGATFTTDPAAFDATDYVLVTVPTPVDDRNAPDLRHVDAAGRSVGAHLSPGTTVVLESTVYPGATEEVLVPALESASGLTCGTDFFVGYSPERSATGDGVPGLRDVVKVVSGLGDEARERVAGLYADVVDAGVYEAPDVRTAEAAKLVENVQRDVNIALVNELAMAFDRMGLETDAVLDAAGTKWNFHRYDPGLVGGHCIPVDPYYFVHSAERHGFTPELTLAGRRVNTSVADHVVEVTTDALARSAAAGERALADGEGPRVLVLGVTFKPDVADTRTSGVDRVVAGLQNAGVEVAAYDPHVDPAVVGEQYGVDAQSDFDPAGFDAMIVATAHSAFAEIEPAQVAGALAPPGLVVDVDGALGDGWRGRDGITYWRL